MYINRVVWGNLGQWDNFGHFQFSLIFPFTTQGCHYNCISPRPCEMTVAVPSAFCFWMSEGKDVFLLRQLDFFLKIKLSNKIKRQSRNYGQIFYFPKKIYQDITILCQLGQWYIVKQKICNFILVRVIWVTQLLDASD